MTTTGVARAGRAKDRGLPSTSWLVLLIGLSCSQRVPLPAAVVVEDAGESPDETGAVQSVDAAIEVSSGVSADASADVSRAVDKPWFPRGGDQCSNPSALDVKSKSVEMIIAVDRSLSMQNSQFDSTTRLQAAATAIAGAMANHPRIQFDLELFPGPQDCGGACCGGAVTPQAVSRDAISVENQIECGSGDSGCPTVGSDSPSHAALQKCNEYFRTNSRGFLSQQFVLLVTDQDPTCEGEPAINGSPCNQAINKIGVQTFVVTFNDARSTVCLASIAALSGSSQLMVAMGQQDLHDKLETIMTTVEESTLCRFFLARAPRNPDKMAVTINNDHVPRGADGWNFVDSSNNQWIEISGMYCSELIQASDSSQIFVQDCGF